MINIAAAQLWVHDQDEALAFYTEKVGFQVQTDVTVAELGNFRWLTVAPPSQPDMGIALMTIPGPAGVRARDVRADQHPDGQGLRRHDLPRHR